MTAARVIQYDTALLPLIHNTVILLIPLWSYVVDSQNPPYYQDNQISFANGTGNSFREFLGTHQRWTVNNNSLTPQNYIGHSNFVQGTVDRVKNWFTGNKGKDGGGVGNTISDMLKGIGKIFKKPADNVLEPTENYNKRSIFQKLRGILRKSFQKRNVAGNGVRGGDRNGFRDKADSGVRNVAKTNAQNAVVTHGWFYTKYGIMPADAFIAGFNRDGKAVYVARGKLNQTDLAVIPGTLRAGRHCVRVAVGKWTRCIFKYQILIGRSYLWYPAVMSEKEWYLHPQSMVGGREAVKDGIVTNYICRTYKDMTLFIGKLHTEKEDSRYRRCIIPYNGKTETVDYYDILVDWWQPY